ncbi:MAG: 6-phosphogluconate dehydrogenase, decarboxylating [Acetothermia bacterium 64_32]|nr:MAG: 6-phosphogluconate dehydrogenase, decarboxylating [Acetothermia bacterium 64_32]HAF71349.1 phosphogluconate dehydrogenase (NADP(+)-dependent, decarboxylating) [Candidatus Acetothermia bacterium]
MASEADFGVVGMAVMGQNLVLNVEGRGFSVAVYNRTAERTKEFVEGRAQGKNIVPTYSLEELVASLKKPRKVLLMVKAGEPTDAVLAKLFPLLERGDLVIDGGNAHYADTERRLSEAEKRGLLYLGTGISGGEYGALRGPSIMAGGHEEGYGLVREIFERIAARGPEGPCCGYFGPGSAGHYVKMVHNGIEYAIMETIAEAYDLMKRGLGMTPDEMAQVFSDWNSRELGGYLVEITERILRYRDPETGDFLVERILDTAKQKGTGKWSTQAALDLGTPAPTIAMAVFSRIISAFKDERAAASKVLSGPDPHLAVDRKEFTERLFGAAYLSVIAAYAQGFRQLRDASSERGWDLDLSEVARVWMAGCIIRSGLLAPIRKAFLDRPELPMLFLAEPFKSAWEEYHGDLRWVTAKAHEHGLPTPAMDSALAFVDAYRTERLPANLIQAQRDFFGAHTYQRVDKEGTFHTDWEAVA